MLYILCVFGLICLYGLKYNKNDFFVDYIDKEQTTSIKGILAIIIAFSHFNQYVYFSNVLENKIYLKIFSVIGQLMVVMFLFYSGYGIYISSNRKKEYFDSFFKNRIVKLIFKFDIIVLLFFIVSLITKVNYGIKDIILSFIGWTAIGNSNWFVFSIIIMYIITYICALLTNKKIKLTTIYYIFMGAIIYIIIMKQMKENWWYNTILCFPLGLLYAYYKDFFEKYINNLIRYMLAMFGGLFIFILTYKYKFNLIIYEINACICCLMVVLVTYKFKIKNKILIYLGEYSFEIYMLQRISYILFQPLLKQYHIIYFLSSIILTIILSYVVKLITNKFEGCVFESRNIRKEI